MVRIELTQDEARILHKILVSYLGELKSEIAATTIDDFAEILQREQAELESVLQHLQDVDASLPASMLGEYD